MRHVLAQHSAVHLHGVDHRDHVGAARDATFDTWIEQVS